MIGAWTEIRDHEGELGLKFARLLYDTVDAVRRFNRYPAPVGSGGWNAETVQDVAHQYLGDPRTLNRIRRLVATATSDKSFELLLQRDVKNWFLILARSTDTGAALDALRHNVEQNPNIVVVGTTPGTRTWSMAAHAQEMQYSGDLRPLVDAAYAVTNVRAAKWRADSRNRRPIAEGDSLRRVIEAILTTAEAPMSPRQVLDVIQARFPATATPTEEQSIHRHDDEDDLASTDPGNDDRIVAAAIWSELSDAGKLVVGLLDDSVRDVMTATGLSRGTAHRAMRAAAATTEGGLQGLGRPDGVVRILKDWSTTVRTDGTEPQGSASAPHKGDT